MTSARSLVAAVVLAAAAAAVARTEDPAALLDAVIACDGIAEPAARLGCFDVRVAELKAARQQDAHLFQAPRREEQPRFTELRSTIATVASLEPGTWLLVLADHSVWQTDDIVRFEPERGEPIRITRGTLGGYVANIGDQRAVRLRRMR
jgi:hypothetical protein